MHAEKALELTCSLPDQPGVFARIGRAFGDAEVNLRGMMNIPQGDGTYTCFVIESNLEEAESILRQNGATNLQRQTIIGVTVDNKPGALASVADVLAPENINIQHLYASEGMTDQPVVYLATNNTDRAYELLNN